MFVPCPLLFLISPPLEFHLQNIFPVFVFDGPSTVSRCKVSAAPL